MRKLLILVPATILALVLTSWFGPSQSSAPIYTVPATPTSSPVTNVVTAHVCDLAPEASDYVSACLSLFSQHNGAAMVAECNDLDMQGQNDYEFQKKLNAEGWNLGECYSAMMK